MVVRTHAAIVEAVDCVWADGVFLACVLGPVRAVLFFGKLVEGCNRGVAWVALTEGGGPTGTGGGRQVVLSVVGGLGKVRGS